MNVEDANVTQTFISVSPNALAFPKGLPLIAPEQWNVLDSITVYESAQVNRQDRIEKHFSNSNDCLLLAFKPAWDWTTLMTHTLGELPKRY